MPSLPSLPLANIAKGHLDSLFSLVLTTQAHARRTDDCRTTPQAASHFLASPVPLKLHLQYVVYSERSSGSIRGYACIGAKTQPSKKNVSTFSISDNTTVIPPGLYYCTSPTIEMRHRRAVQTCHPHSRMNRRYASGPCGSYSINQLEKRTTGLLRPWRNFSPISVLSTIPLHPSPRLKMNQV